MADAEPAQTLPSSPPDNPRSRPLRRLGAWHRRRVQRGVDRAAVLARVHAEAGWSSRFAFMATLSAGIAILGLLLSSPAVIIGAMLISPLMGPIIGLGFALGTFDWAQVRTSLIALALGTLLAVGFTALIVLASPLQDLTPEILARTRPNLFDLLVAVFSALAGGYATVRGRGETIVGVAIATALMPPLAVVGFGLATGNGPVLWGALALYVTNFIAIALSATLVARFYGFGADLSPYQSRRQGVALALVLVALAVPLAVSLRQIAWEAFAARSIRSAVADEFGDSGRIASLDPAFGDDGITVHATVLSDRVHDKAGADLERRLARELGRPVTFRLNQILVDGPERQRAALVRATAAPNRSAALAEADLALRLHYATGAPPTAVLIDGSTRRAVVSAAPDRGPAALHALEERLRREVPGWDIRLVPAVQPLPPILFPEGAAEADEGVAAQLHVHLWAIERWGTTRVRVAGSRARNEPARLAGERAAAVAALIEACGIAPAIDDPGLPEPSDELERGRAPGRNVRIVPALEAPPASDPPAADGGEPLPPCIRVAPDSGNADSERADGPPPTTFASG
jgi:uncharacterized hydrophobic protein (TIGR00271 family)